MSPAWAEPLRRVWPRPNLLEVALTIGWVALVALADSNVDGGGIVGGCLYFLGAAVLGLLWLARFFVCLGARLELPRRVQWTRRDAPRWLAFPAAFALVYAAQFDDVVFRLRFAASESALESLAAPAASPTSVAYLPSRRAGCFWISELVADGDVTRLTTGRGLGERLGLAYAPRTRPPNDYKAGLAYWHLEGAWWGWSQIDSASED